MISANKLAVVQQTLYIPVWHFQSIGQVTGASIQLDTTGSGDAVFAPINSLAQNGLLMASAGDDVHHFMAIPTDWAREHNISVSVVYTTGSATAADTIDWKFLYHLIAPETAADTIVIPATALDTVIAQDTVHGTAYVVQRSPQGVINGDTIAAADRYMSFLVEMDAFAAGLTEDKLLLGVEFEYTPKWYKGKRRAGAAWSHDGE